MVLGAVVRVVVGRNGISVRWVETAHDGTY